MTPDKSSSRDGSLFARGAVVTSLSRGTTGVFQLAAQVMAARLLGPAGLGIWALGLTTVRALGVLLSWGPSQSIIRFGSALSRPGLVPRSRAVTALVVIGSGAGLIGAAVLFAMAEGLSSAVFDKPGLGPVLRIMAPALVAFAAIEALAAVTRLTKKMTYSAVARDLGPATLHLGLLAVCLVASWGVVEASVATSTAYVLGAVLAFYILRRIPRAPVESAAAVPSRGEIVRYTGMATAAGLFGFVTTRADLLFVGALMDSASTGYYAAAVQFALVFSLVMAAFGTIFAPLCAELFSTDEMGRLKELYRSSTRWGLYVTVPVIVPLLIISPDVLHFVYGGEFVAAASPLRLLLVAQLVHVSLGLVYTLMMMTGGERVWLQLSGFAAVIGVGLPLLLIPRYGLVGAALSTAVTTTFLMASGVWAVRARLGTFPHDARSWRVLYLAIGCAAAVLVTRALVSGSPGIAVALAFSASAVAAGLVLAVPGFGPEDRDFARLLRRGAANDE